MKDGCNLNGTDLNSVLPLQPRQEVSDPDTTFTASGDQLRVLGNDSSFVYIPFNDLRNGHYRMEVSFGGSATGISIIDSDGYAYYSSGNETLPQNGQKSIDFNVSEIADDYPSPAGLIIDTGTSMSVSYSATATLSTSAGAPTSTKPPKTSGAYPVTVSSWPVYLAVAGGSMWILGE